MTQLEKCNALRQPDYSGVVPDERPAVKIVLVLDGSGSMIRWQKQTEEALRYFLAGLRNNKETNFLVTSIWFDSDIEVQCLRKPLELAEIWYKARGGTALWDGVYRAFELEPERKTPVICLIITDGEDNASWKVEKLAQLKGQNELEFIQGMVQARIDWGNWTFVWLGMAGSGHQATNVGITEVLDFDREDIGQVLGELSGKVKKFAQTLRMTGKKATKLLV